MPERRYLTIEPTKDGGAFVVERRGAENHPIALCDDPDVACWIVRRLREDKGTTRVIDALLRKRRKSAKSLKSNA